MDGDRTATCLRCNQSWTLPAPGVVVAFGARGASPPMDTRMLACPSCGTFFAVGRIVSGKGTLAYLVAATVLGALVGGALFRWLGGLVGSLVGLALGLAASGFIKRRVDEAFRRHVLRQNPRAEEPVGKCRCAAAPVEITGSFKLRCPTCETRTLRLL